MDRVISTEDSARAYRNEWFKCRKRVFELESKNEALKEKLRVATSENRAIIDYNTIKENLEMERIQHGIEIKALEEKLKVATAIMREAYGSPDLYTYYEMMPRLKQALELITKESE